MRATLRCCGAAACVLAVALCCDLGFGRDTDVTLRCAGCCEVAYRGASVAAMRGCCGDTRVLPTILS